MNLPSLTVVMPNYNHGRYLPTSLQAIVDQSVAPLEIIVIDDASTDNSLEVLSEFERKHPNLKVYRNEKNQGVVYNLKRGFELARGQFLLFTAADDKVEPGFFEKSLRLLAEHPQAGLSCTLSTWRYAATGLTWHMGVGMVDRPRYLSPDELVRVAKRGKLAISSSSVLIRRDAFQEFGGFRRDLDWHSDWFLYHACAFRYGVCVVPELLSVFNILPNSHYSTGRRRPEHRQVLVRILELLNSTPFADIRERIRDSGVLSLFATPILRIMWSRREFRSFINLTLVRRIAWRSSELIGSKLLPVWLARWVLNRLYRLPNQQA